MSWLTGVDNSAFLASLFPGGGPSLAQVNLHEVQLNRDGPTVLLRFDLDTFPTNPPPKWRASGFNTVQVRLMGIGMHRFSLSGWGTTQFGPLSILTSARGVEVRFTSGEVTLDACFHVLRIDGVSGYVNGAL